jgi:hypothetical protein
MSTISKDEFWVWTPGGWWYLAHNREIPEPLYSRLKKAVAEFNAVQQEINKYLEAEANASVGRMEEK